MFFAPIYLLFAHDTNDIIMALRSEKYILTHISLASLVWDINSADSDQAPHIAVSDQDIHCLQNILLNFWKKKKYTTQDPLNWK